MINYKIYLFFGLWILSALGGGCHSLAAVVGQTDDAMTIGGGARPIGMGRTFTAIANDADAQFINPAGLGGLKGPQAMSMFTNLMGEVYYNEFAGAVPTPLGTLGMGYISTGVNGIPASSGAIIDYYDTLLTVTYSSPLARFFNYGRNVFFGVNYKIFNRGYNGGPYGFATGYSADFGLKFIYNSYLSLGLSRQNFIPVSMGGVIRLNSGAEESLASLIKIGIAARPVFQKDVLAAADVDLPAQSGRPLTAHLGAEWKINKYLTLRGGLDQSVDPATATQTSWNPAFGTSFGVGGLRFDYAYHAYYNDPSLANHYISISYMGEPWFALKGKAE